MKTEIEIKEKISDFEKAIKSTELVISTLKRHSQQWCEMVDDVANKRSKINLLKWVLSDS